MVTVTKTTFDPETYGHPIPASVREADAVDAQVPYRRTYVIYLTLDFDGDEEIYEAEELAGAVAGLWEKEPGPGRRQGVTVYVGKV